MLWFSPQGRAHDGLDRDRGLRGPAEQSFRPSFPRGVALPLAAAHPHPEKKSTVQNALMTKRPCSSTSSAALSVPPPLPAVPSGKRPVAARTDSTPPQADAPAPVAQMLSAPKGAAARWRHQSCGRIIRGIEQRPRAHSSQPSGADRRAPSLPLGRSPMPRHSPTLIASARSRRNSRRQLPTLDRGRAASCSSHRRRPCQHDGWRVTSRVASRVS